MENGGTFVTTYYSGMADKHLLSFLDGFPGPLRELLGIWVEETDALDDGETRLGAWLGDMPLPKRKLGRNWVVPALGNLLGLQGDYEARHFCDLLHLKTIGICECPNRQ